MKTLHLDFETYSTLDLTEVGVENYVRSPDFCVTVVGWAFDDEPVGSIMWPNTTLPPEVRQHIAKGGTVKAWNAAFEFNILNLHYNVSPTHGQMDCVMQRSLAYGLPAKLEAAGPAMKLPIVKDATARRLMLKMGKPKADGTAWHVDQSYASGKMLNDLAAYCRRDVEAERALDKVIPPLHPFERRLSLVDAAINEAGVLIDRAACISLQFAALYEASQYKAECVALTGGVVQSPGTETAKMLLWLESEGYVLPDLTKETVAKALAKGGGNAATKRVLEIRQLVAKASLAKIERMIHWASIHDGRARNLLQFYGAGRTGRWAGRGIQVQNLPRVPKGTNPEDAIKVAQADHEALGLLWQSPMKAISQSLRSCLIARPNHTLVSIDLSQIEARVLAWLAGQQDVLDAFARGEDIYTYAAAKQGSKDRQFGKVLVLACGYGMGADKFRETALTYGVQLTLGEADAAVRAWRQDNHLIQTFWWDMQRDAIDCVENPGKVNVCRRLMLRSQGGVFQIRKPNGVKLTWQNPRIENGDFAFDSVGQQGGGWVRLTSYGGKFVENVTQSVARDVMAEALLSAPLPVMTVHDEIVWEVPEGNVARLAAEQMRQVVESPPAWAHDLPIASEIKISRRYGGM